MANGDKAHQLSSFEIPKDELGKSFSYARLIPRLIPAHQNMNIVIIKAEVAWCPFSHVSDIKSRKEGERP